MRTVLIFLALLFSIKAKASESAWKFGGGVGYSSVYLLNMEGTSTVSAKSTSMKYEYQYTSGVNFGIDVWYIPKDNWGFITGFEYGPKRKYKSGKLNNADVTPTNAGSFSEVQTHLVYGGPTYRFDSFYIPIGFTYGFTNLTSSLPNETITGGLGFSFGLGWFIGEHMAVEFLIRSAGFTYEKKSGTSLEKNTGAVGADTLNLKLFF